MSGVNKVILVGHIGKAPELKRTQGGKAVLKFSLATSEKYKDKNGEQKESTEWHRCVMFDKIAETMSKYLDKGKQIYVEGKLKTSSYDKDGVKHYSTDVIVTGIQLLGSKSGSGSSNRPSAPADDPPAAASDLYPVDEDQLPF